MERRLPVAEGQHTLEILKRLFINGMLEHRVTNRLKMISMSIQLQARKPVALELKLTRQDTDYKPKFFLEVFSYYTDGSGPAHMDPDVITMETNEANFIVHVNC
jgi:hypothetical protein